MKPIFKILSRKLPGWRRNPHRHSGFLPDLLDLAGVVFAQRGRDKQNNFYSISARQLGQIRKPLSRSFHNYCWIVHVRTVIGVNSGST